MTINKKFPHETVAPNKASKVRLPSAKNVSDARVHKSKQNLVHKAHRKTKNPAREMAPARGSGGGQSQSGY